MIVVLGLVRQTEQDVYKRQALDGLSFLCAFPNMETHADLIAGLPLDHLHEIFEDVRTCLLYTSRLHLTMDVIVAGNQRRILHIVGRQETQPVSYTHLRFFFL